MSIPYRTQLNRNRPEQIKLFVRCVSESQSEALWRTLRKHFARVSNPMQSFDSSFSHFFFVETSEDALRASWEQIVAVIAPLTIGSSTSPAVQPQNLAKQPPLGDFAGWERKFREAVRLVHEEIPKQSKATQAISLHWVVDQVRNGNAEAVESELSRPLLSPTSVLRAQIALFSETGQSERLIALVESRRREVLALPASGLLATQIVSAYLAFGQTHAIEDALRSAQRIAQAFMPELERLGQASALREMLRQGFDLITAQPESVIPTLREQIAGIVQVAPSEQIAALETLRSHHAGAFELHLALGDAYAAIGQIDTAREAYTHAKLRDDEERGEVLSRQAELLVAARRYPEALELLPQGEELPPNRTALRGVALYWQGHAREARQLLEDAWEAGERRRALLLPLARSRVTNGQDNLALQVYRLLLDNASDELEPEDLAQLALGFYSDCPEDITEIQIAKLCEKYVELGGLRTRPIQEATDLLHIRSELWPSEDQEHWLEVRTDLLEWLANQRRIADLKAEFDMLRNAVQRSWLGRNEQFELLEALELTALEHGELKAMLADEYQAICTAVVATALLRNEPIPAFIQSIQRSLHFLDRNAADFITVYIDDERKQLAQRNMPVVEQIFAHEQTANLANLSLTIVGGHVAMRREVEQVLCERYGLVDYLEIGPSSDEHIDRLKVRDRVVGRNLVAVITGYMGHDLTNLVRDFQRTGELSGHVIWLKCRGKSGVVREILGAMRYSE